MKKLLTLAAVIACSSNFATTISATMFSTDGSNKQFGQIEFKDSKYGLIITPKLSQLPPGLHGFHLHQHHDCTDKAMNAGGHYDPANTNSHQGPLGEGHLGDLPVLTVISDGKSITPLLAPRLKTSDLNELSVMIHEGGDNYSDNPPMGGGGNRIACGVIVSLPDKK